MITEMSDQKHEALPRVTSLVREKANQPSSDQEEFMDSTEIHCSKCGVAVQNQSRFCQRCGNPLGTIPEQQPPPLPPPTPSRVASDYVYPRNPPLSPHIALLNILLPGVAQMVFGQVGKGILIIALVLFVLPPIVAALISMCGIGIPFAAVIIVLTCRDAYSVGRVLESGRPVGKWDWMPR